MPTERVAMTYQGLDIVLPVNMTAEKPFIWLQKNGRYYVELADTELGMLVRIDNYLDKLEEHLEKMQTSLSDMYARQSATKAELSQKENYTDKIEEIKAQLEKLDKKLGVNKK
jgi:DNA repair ATPase RecN